mmetsp:Transcript_8369/g.17979  ORF Transcript_8369/g.17979 Transcript_8369/m.17979 type:complete len:215 (+) Transcript_8369:5518-6162(+)
MLVVGLQRRTQQGGCSTTTTTRGSQLQPTAGRLILNVHAAKFRFAGGRRGHAIVIILIPTRRRASPKRYAILRSAALGFLQAGVKIHRFRGHGGVTGASGRRRRRRRHGSHEAPSASHHAAATVTTTTTARTTPPSPLEDLIFQRIKFAVQKVILIIVRVDHGFGIVRFGAEFRRVACTPGGFVMNGHGSGCHDDNYWWAGFLVVVVGSFVLGL